MTWVKLDDGFAEHPKILEVGPVAGWLHVTALCYCSRYLTDGIIPKATIRRTTVANAAKHAARLVDVGLWYDEGDSYRIHDFLVYQPSKAKVLADREIANRRSAMNADPDLRKILQERDRGRCRYCDRAVNWKDRRGPIGGTYDHVIPLSKGGDESTDNLVVACRDCNARKAARTPHEAAMPLLPPRSHLDSVQKGQGPPSRPGPTPDPLTSSVTAADTPAARQQRIDEAARIVARRRHAHRTDVGAGYIHATAAGIAADWHQSLHAALTKDPSLSVDGLAEMIEPGPVVRGSLPLASDVVARLPPVDRDLNCAAIADLRKRRAR